MKIEYIETLLKDFYDGNTSLEQEKELLQFFRSEQVPDKLQEEKMIFISCYEPESTKNVPASLKNKLNTLIDQESRKSEKKKRMELFMSMNWLKFTTAAAGLLLLLTISLKPYQTAPSMSMTDTCSNRYEAYRETQKALALVSKNLQRGLKQKETAETEIEKVQDIVNKQIETLSR
jgi:hypothetical protein